jgi:hypothetical protein
MCIAEYGDKVFAFGSNLRSTPNPKPQTPNKKTPTANPTPYTPHPTPYMVRTDTLHPATYMLRETAQPQSPGITAKRHHPASNRPKP